MDSYSLHLIMAALVGASVVAVCDLFMHRKMFSDLIELAKARELESQRDNEDAADDEVSPRHSRPVSDKRRIHDGRRSGEARRSGMAGYRRVSSSLPDVTAISRDAYGGEGVTEERRNGPAFSDEGIPIGLPPLHTVSEGKYGNHANTKSRAVHLIRPTSPRSPGASAFGSIEGSDDDEDILTESSKLDDTYMDSNGNAEIPEENANSEQVSHACSSMIRSHSVSGDLHPDPVAADILRKEPEHETFVRLRITPFEMPTPDEVESYMVLQKCLELRESYIFREAVAPWEKEVISDPSTPKPNTNPFQYYPIGKSDHFFQMEDGVVQVYANKESKEKMFHVADATTFFTDLHHILRVIAAGNIRTLCYHRLGLLEQKFNLHLMLNADKEFLAQKSAPHRDFYNVRKVDTHVHHSACMNQKHLLRFIKSKLRKEPDEVVIFRDGTYLTLKEVFESLDLTGYDLNVDLLDVHADKSTFHRFDKFNLKYNPCGQSRLREIFLKQDNLIQALLET